MCVLTAAAARDVPRYAAAPRWMAGGPRRARRVAKPSRRQRARVLERARARYAAVAAPAAVPDST